jgi:hypothetical protein
MWPHFVNLAFRTWSALMQKSSLSTFGFILFSLLVPVVAGSLAAFLAYLKDRKERKLSRKAVILVGMESAGITLGAVVVAVGIAYLGFFVPTVYGIHISQQQDISGLREESRRLSSDIQDRKLNIRVEEPAYEHMKVVYSMYARFRSTIGANRPCEIRITAPNDSGTSVPIIRQLGDPAGGAARCAAFGPMIMNMDPKEEELASGGMEPGMLIIHTRKDQVGSLALYDALASYLPVKRSFAMPKNSPKTLIWFQFGKDVRWLQ